MEAARAAGIELAQLKSREELLQETLGYVKGKEGGFGAGLNEKYTPSMVISGEAAQRELKFHPTQMNREASRRQTAMYLGRDLPPEGYALRAKRVRTTPSFPPFLILLSHAPLFFFSPSLLRSSDPVFCCHRPLCCSGTGLRT